MRRWLAVLLLLALLPAPSHSQDRNPLAAGEHEVELRGVRLWYLVRGSGPPLLIQPGGAGWGGDATIYIETLKPLEDSFTLIYLEPRGIGRSARVTDPALYSLDHYVEDVEALRRHLRLERLTIAGHSHGGFVALKYALAYPEHVDRLLLLNSGAFVRELDAEWMAARAGHAEAQARWEAVDKNLPDDELHAEFLRTFVPVVHFYDFRAVASTVETLLARTRFSVEPFRQFGREMATFDIRDAVHAIRAPTLIVIGDHDLPDLMEGSFLLHEQIPRSHLLVTPGCGHMPMMECPEVFFTGVRRFLAQPSPNRATTPESDSDSRPRPQPSTHGSPI